MRLCDEVLVSRCNTVDIFSQNTHNRHYNSPSLAQISFLVPPFLCGVIYTIVLIWGVRVGSGPCGHGVVTKAQFDNFYTDEISAFVKCILNPLNQMHIWIYNVTFISDRCRRSRATATPVRYGRDIHDSVLMTLKMKTRNGKNWFSDPQPYTLL